MERLIGIDKAASVLCVSIPALRRWKAEGKLVTEHTAGGHHRYDLAKPKLKPELFHAKVDTQRRTVALDGLRQAMEAFSMLIAHRIALAPNNVQVSDFARAAGTTRFTYNWALAEWKRQYEAWKLDNSHPSPPRPRCAVN